jgi:hypothetical protein
MALTGAPFPYDIENLLGGAVRILWAPAAGTGAASVPDSMADVIDMEDPYAAVTPWADLGATKESFTYSRGFDTSGYEIQQVAGNVIEEITDITRSIEISYADFRPEHLQMIENAPAVADVAAAAGASAQKKVAFGAFSSPVQYRFAFVSMRPRQSGTVEESGGKIRGRFFMGVAYLAQVAADEISFEQAKGELTGAGVTFQMFPQGGQPTGEEWGAWYDELAGTIA